MDIFQAGEPTIPIPPPSQPPSASPKTAVVTMAAVRRLIMELKSLGGVERLMPFQFSELSSSRLLCFQRYYKLWAYFG